MQFNSLCVHERSDKSTTPPHVLPIYATSSFDFETINDGIDIFAGKTAGHSYSRYANPTVDAVAEKIAALESFGLDVEATAYMVSSGMAAISTLMLKYMQTIPLKISPSALR